MIQEIVFGMNIASLLLIIIAIIFLIKTKKFESDSIKLLFNLVLIGLIFITIVIAYDSLLSSAIFAIVANKLQNLPLNILSLIIELMIIPISALVFLLGLLHLRTLEQ